MRECMNGCMGKNTKITMGDGSEKRIADMRIGDVVMLSTGETSVVNDNYAGSESLMIRIKTNDSELIVTRDHPILLEDKTWAKAQDLKIHDTICTKNGSAEIILTEVIEYGGSVYNPVISNNLKDCGILANGLAVGDIHKQNSMHK